MNHVRISQQISGDKAGVHALKKSVSFTTEGVRMQIKAMTVQLSVLGNAKTSTDILRTKTVWDNMC